MATEAAFLAEDGGMVGASRYTIERVPCALPTLLVQSGRLKRPPNMPRADVRGYRPATAADADALTWLVAWDGKVTDHTGLRNAAGSIAFVDRFDWHSSSEVREVVFITGTPRAIRDLILHIRCENRRVVGLIEIEDHENLSNMMTRVTGCTATRVLYEDRT